MRSLAVALLVAAMNAACFAPLPCSQALCPEKVAGSYRVNGWTRSVISGADTPQTPIVSDSSVKILEGSVDFKIRATTLRAASGTSFHFELSTGSLRTPEISVIDGMVTVITSSGPAVNVSSGLPYILPSKP